MGYADLHVHTTASDGALAPALMVAQARRAGLCALGITDHDTVDGIAEAMAAGEAAGLEIVPGVEINTDYPGEEVHVLGYYPDLHDQQFLGLLEELRESRRWRLDAMIEKLRSLGLDVCRERVLEIAGSAAPGRLHVAKALRERNLVRDVREAFSKYLAVGGPAYVERARIDPAGAVASLLQAGAVPVLAHPGLLSSQAIVPTLVEHGLMGLEAYYPGHDPGTVVCLLRQAERYGLLVTGGSDSHGEPEAHTGEVGSVRVPYEHVEAIRRVRSGIRSGGHRYNSTARPQGG